ncbi:MAG: GntR family transcriptional regulator, partial [Chloroflexi bacterium]|nr:GntR family transcriptional regulator [Chloroflexota bacterium]
LYGYLDKSSFSTRMIVLLLTLKSFAVREAIRILEQQGLVEARPKNGTYVASINWDEVCDSLYTRMALEELAVRQAIERLTAQQWDDICRQLQRLLEGMREAITKNDSIAATELDLEWHTLLIDAAQNRYLSRIWRISGLPFLVWSPERELYPFTPERWAVFYQRHEELLAGLRGRNPDQCAQVVRTHILSKLSDINERLA